jgi:cadmium resistance protein CadD (predicted permease)
MRQLLVLLGIAVALFASTNVDDIFVLVGFFADRKFQTRNIVLGQYAGIAMLFAVSLLASLLSLVVPRPYLGLLGLVPIIIAAQRLLDLYRHKNQSEAILERHTEARAYGQSATVALITIAHGGDNIGIYTPAFAIRSGHEVAIVTIVFGAMTALWCFSAYWLAHHPRLGAPIRRYDHRVTPFVLIGLGFLILHEAGSLSLISRLRGL